MKVIIIGAGAAGLMAANYLSKKGIGVVLLEADNRLGGRIHTFTPPGFTNHIEAGAEFIHGNLPLTLQLMKKAKLPYYPTGGDMYRYENGQINKRFGQGKDWELFYDALEKKQRDCTLQELLDKQFAAAEYTTLRKEVREMAQGLDLADIAKLSVFGIRKEWASEETQYRPLMGYSPLLEFVRNDAEAQRFELHFGQRVTEIQWKPRSVNVLTENAEYKGDAVILAVSIGIIFNREIKIVPKIEGTLTLFDAIGFGEVIKIALEFDHAFWEEKYRDLGFLFTSEGFTFWTQLSQHRPLLIGWIGNDYASAYTDFSDDVLLEMALAKLVEAFKPDGQEVRELFKAGLVFRYTKNSAPRGGYTWLTTKSKSAIKKINNGIADTIWFAGEALHPGVEVGTVEAALQSGRYVGKKLGKLGS